MFFPEYEEMYIINNSQSYMVDEIMNWLGNNEDIYGSHIVYNDDKKIKIKNFPWYGRQFCNCSQLSVCFDNFGDRIRIIFKLKMYLSVEIFLFIFFAFAAVFGIILLSSVFRYSLHPIWLLIPICVIVALSLIWFICYKLSVRKRLSVIKDKMNELMVA